MSQQHLLVLGELCGRRKCDVQTTLNTGDIVLAFAHNPKGIAVEHLPWVEQFEWDDDKHSTWN